MGAQGMFRFFMNHQCSALCAQLGLRPRVNPADPTPRGTVLQTYTKQDAEQWLRRRRIDPRSTSWCFTTITFTRRDMPLLILAAVRHVDTLEELSLADCELHDDEAIEL